EEICHRHWPEKFGRAERQAANGPKLLLELAGHARVEAEMTGVVRTRRELVDEQRVIGKQKHFDRDQTDQLQLLSNRTSEFARRALDRSGYTRRHDREIQDVIPMQIFAERVGLHRPVDAPRDDDGKLFGKGDELSVVV